MHKSKQKKTFSVFFIQLLKLILQKKTEFMHMEYIDNSIELFKYLKLFSFLNIYMPILFYIIKC